MPRTRASMPSAQSSTLNTSTAAAPRASETGVAPQNSHPAATPNSMLTKLSWFAVRGVPSTPRTTR